MNPQRRITLAVACACASLAAGQASAFEVANKDGWKLDVNGTVNAFYVNSKAKTTDPAVNGGATTDNKQANVQNGLLPGWLNFVVTTQQEGYDIKAHFGYAPGINSSSTIVGLPDGTGQAFAQTDHRNVYLQFGNASMGTIKMGRDIGLFAQTPILNDMTLLGVGGTPRAAEPFNTSFGMIGHGYMYVGFQPQITYSMPAMGGFNASAGLFNPSQYAGDQRKTPGLQGLVTYDWKGGVNGKVWASFVNQKTSGTTGCVGNADCGFKASGYEGGVKLGLGAFELLASGFSGKGLGISTIGAQFLGGLDVNDNPMKSDGVFVQGTVKAADKVKLGLSYGKNTDKNAVAAGPESTNEAVAAGVYYNLTKSVTLVGEYVAEKGKNVVTLVTANPSLDTVKTNTVSLGAILFF
jgi:predicted porin